MSTRSARWSRIALAVPVPLGIILASGIVWQVSQGAFEAETRNSGNSWASGRVALSDDDAGSARFNVTGMVPGDGGTRCLKVTSTSSVVGEVRFYVLNPVPSPQGLEDHLKLSVDQGDGGDFASCTGFVSEDTIVPTASLTSITSTYATYGTGAGAWTTTGNASGETKTYRFTWSFDGVGLTQSELDQLQNSSTGIDFEWEIQTP